MDTAILKNNVEGRECLEKKSIQEHYKGLEDTENLSVSKGGKKSLE